MKMTTSFERIFQKRTDGLYQEVINHFIHFIDVNGNKTTKLDKTIRGNIYREDNENRSHHGEAFYTFADDGQKRRLVALHPEIKPDQA